MTSQETSGYEPVSPEKLRPVASFPNVIEADIVQMELHASGINSRLDNQYTVAANPLISGAVGGVTVLVAQDDFAAARELIESRRKAAAEQHAAAMKTCPKCGCPEGCKIERSFAFWVLLLLTLGLLVPLLHPPQFKCPKCGHKWRSN